jgi:outer membrane protein assembly factor BamB
MAVRFAICLLGFLALGCGGVQTGKETARPQQEEPAAAPAAAEPSGPPPDLRTRKTGSDWPGFLGPLGTSVSPENGILAPWPAKGLHLVWQKQTGVGYGMPSVSRGRLFLFDRRGDKERLLCLKSETGDFLWKYEYPTAYDDAYGYDNGPRCCPVVDDDRVYTYGAEGVLHCLRVLDGKPLWKVDTRKEFHVVPNFFGVGSTPAVEGDLLIVQVGGTRDGDDVPFTELRGNKSGVVAFDKRTGKVRYRVSDELAGYASPVPATVNGRRWCFVLARGGLIGLEPATGKVHFHFPWRSRKVESVNASNPVVVGDRVFISETYGPGSALLKVKPGGCEVVWSDEKARDKSMQCHWMTPIYHDGYLYGCSGRHPENAELRCIELATGKVMWSEPDLTRTSLLLVDGHFVCLGEDAVLRLLKVNPKKYEEVSRLVVRDPSQAAEDAPPLLERPCWAAPILAHGLLYVRGRDRLVCLELIPEKR